MVNNNEQVLWRTPFGWPYRLIRAIWPGDDVVSPEIFALQEEIAALQTELETLPQGARTLAEGQKRIAEIEKSLTSKSTEVREIRKEITRKEQEVEEELEFQEIEQQQLLFNKRMNDIADYTEALVDDAAIWKGSTLTAQEEYDVRRIANRIVNGQTTRRPGTGTWGPLIDAWRLRDIPDYQGIDRTRIKGKLTYFDPRTTQRQPGFGLGGLGLGELTPIPGIEAEAAVSPPAEEGITDVDQQDFILGSETKDLIRTYLALMADVSPEDIPDDVLQDSINNIERFMEDADLLPLDEEVLTSVMFTVFGDDVQGKAPVNEVWAKDMEGIEASASDIESFRKLEDKYPILDLTSRSEMEGAIQRMLVGVLQEAKAWDYDLAQSDTNTLISYIGNLTDDIYGEAMLSLLGRGGDIDDSIQWRKVINEGIARKVNEIESVGGINAAVISPPSAQKKIRTYLSGNNMIPDSPSNEWMGQIENIGAALEARLSIERDRAAAAGTTLVEGPIIAEVIKSRLRTEEQISAEKLDFRTRFDAISQRPQRVSGEQPEDIDILLNNAFERTKRRYRLAVAAGKDASFEAISAMEVGTAQKQASMVSEKAALALGADAPGTGFTPGGPLSGTPMSDDDREALLAFNEAVTGEKRIDAATLTSLYGHGLSLSLIAGRRIIEQQKEAKLAQEQQEKQLADATMRQQQFIQREQELTEMATGEELGEEDVSQLQARLAPMVEPEPVAEPATLTRAELLSTPTGQEQFQATSALLASQVRRKRQQEMVEDEGVQEEVRTTTPRGRRIIT